MILLLALACPPIDLFIDKNGQQIEPFWIRENYWLGFKGGRSYAIDDKGFGAMALAGQLRGAVVDEVHYTDGWVVLRVHRHGPMKWRAKVWMPHMRKFYPDLSDAGIKELKR